MVKLTPSGDKFPANLGKVKRPIRSVVNAWVESTKQALQVCIPLRVITP